MRKGFFVDPDGNTRQVPLGYEGIKNAIGDHTPFDLVRVSKTAAFFIDDEGMLNGALLNVPASIFAGRPIWGPVVLTAGEPNDDGDSMPPDETDVNLLGLFAQMWKQVLEAAIALGQNIFHVADPFTIPPPTITSLDSDQFDEFLRTGKIPTQEGEDV
jgi:hypothetical protein